MDDLVFIKWGGSLITDKDKPLTIRADVIQNLSEELATIIQNNPKTKFLLGHGSGSFGHSVAKQHNTVEGVNSISDWWGFSEVWYAAKKLNNQVIDYLHHAGISCIALQPSSSFITNNHQIQDHFPLPITATLKTNILPVVYGDVVFDETLGGTIVSTEEIFYYLAKKLNPSRILLAGLEDSIWFDFPENKNAIKKITLSNFEMIKNKIGQSASVDVTGGMIEKVRIMLNLTSQIPNLKIAIFSGTEQGNLTRAFNNQEIGTWIEQE